MKRRHLLDGVVGVSLTGGCYTVLTNNGNENGGGQTDEEQQNEPTNGDGTTDTPPDVEQDNSTTEGETGPDEDPEPEQDENESGANESEDTEQEYADAQDPEENPDVKTNESDTASEDEANSTQIKPEDITTNVVNIVRSDVSILADVRVTNGSETTTGAVEIEVAFTDANGKQIARGMNGTTALVVGESTIVPVGAETNKADQVEETTVFVYV